MRLIDVWYSRITEADILAALEATGLMQGQGRGGPPRQRPGDLLQGSGQGPAPRIRFADLGRRRPARHRRRSADHPACRHPGHDNDARDGVQRLPRDPGREPARVPRALPVRRLSPSRSSVSAASAPAASWSSSKVATRTIRSSSRRSRPRRRSSSRTSQRAATRTMASGSSSASGSCSRRRTSSSAGRAVRAGVITTSANSGT